MGEWYICGELARETGMQKDDKIGSGCAYKREECWRSIMFIIESIETKGRARWGWRMEKY